MNLPAKILSKEAINDRFLDAVQQVLVNGLAGSKSDLAEAFGIKPAKFSEILNGRMKAGVDMIAVICDMFYISPDWLLMSRGENPFRKSDELPPITIFEGDSIRPPFLTDGVEEQAKEPAIQATNPNVAPFIQIIKEKDDVIREQAEEIGRLKEQLKQAKRRLEKDASAALTSGIANVG